MIGLAFQLLPLLVIGITANHLSYPGTKDLPILSAKEASLFTQSTYLGNWIPDDIPKKVHPNYIVGKEQQYQSIQQAVNAAIREQCDGEVFIQVNEGIYKETVFIPQTSVNITIYGAGKTPSDVKIIFKLSANTLKDDYVNTVGKRYKKGDPSYDIYYKCATQSKPTLGTTCSSIVQIQADNVQIARITIENPATDSQGVAVQTTKDRIIFDSVQIWGFQDTFYVKGNENRIFVTNSQIKGDTDFVLGRATAVFKNCTFVARGQRKNKAVIFAPSTLPDQHYGFLVTESQLEAENNINDLSIARAWDEGVKAGQYVPGESPNGQLVVRECTVVGVVNRDAPYRASTSGRQYSGNADKERNLNDPRYNRFWQYNNNGDGA